MKKIFFICKSVLFLMIFLVTVSSCTLKEEKDLTIDLIVLDLSSSYNELTRNLIIEYPLELRHKLYSQELFITINNRYGLKSNSGASKKLREECALLLPKTQEEYLADSCIIHIAEKSFEQVINEANPVKVQSINLQSSMLRSIILGADSTAFHQDIHIDDAIDILNSALSNKDVNIKIEISERLTFGPKYPRDSYELDQVMPYVNEFNPKTVMDAIGGIVFLSRSCLRQRPGLVWIGSSCSDYSDD